MRSNWAVAFVGITAMVGLGASRAGAEPLTAGRIQHYVPDARARAMGQSSVAATDGEWSAWSNPAALAWARGKAQGAYSYLAGEDSTWTTGSSIVVDGGYAAP